MDCTWKFLGRRILIHSLELKLLVFREAMHLQCLPIRRYVDDPLLNIMYMLPACLLALYGSTLQCNSTLRLFSDNSFFCLVLAPLYKKSTTNQSTSLVKNWLSLQCASYRGTWSTTCHKNLIVPCHAFRLLNA